MDTKIYYDSKGKAHKIATVYSFGRYIIYLDGVYYTAVDDRGELNEAVSELITYRHFSATKPSKRKSKKEVRA